MNLHRPKPRGPREVYLGAKQRNCYCTTEGSERNDLRCLWRSLNFLWRSTLQDMGRHCRALDQIWAQGCPLGGPHNATPWTPLKCAATVPEKLGVWGSWQNPHVRPVRPPPNTETAGPPCVGLTTILLRQFAAWHSTNFFFGSAPILWVAGKTLSLCFLLSLLSLHTEDPDLECDAWVCSTKSCHAEAKSMRTSHDWKSQNWQSLKQ